MSTDTRVRKIVLDVVRKLVRPGSPVTRTVWKAAYAIARDEAIRETIAWKKQYITIEEC